MSTTEQWQTYLQDKFIEETEFIPLIYSIKILREKERFWKQQIKRLKNQVKGGKNVVSTLNSEYDRKIGNLRKKNINKDKRVKNKYICHHCGFLHMTKDSFEQYCFKKYCNCETHQEYTEFNKKKHIGEKYKIKIRAAEYCVLCDIMILDNSKKIYDIIKKRIIQISQVCPYCKKKSDTILPTNCLRGHKVCQDCFDKVEDNCPFCFGTIKVECCDICYSKVPELVSTKCGNGHQCCQSCLTKISSICNSCPFCRCTMSSN